ncbi:phage integrase N-terminal SAM-like domain-containing protein [Gayadomonas joobiniege]
MEPIRTELRTKHYSYATEKSYLHWVRTFIRFNGFKHSRSHVNYF